MFSFYHFNQRSIIAALFFTLIILGGCKKEVSDAPSNAGNANHQGENGEGASSHFPEVSPAQAEEALKEGFAWLIAQQGEDGGWHSEEYAALNGGAAMTTLVLYTAAHLPEAITRDHAEALNKGIEFLRPGMEEKGYVVCVEDYPEDPFYSPDYPVYSSAMLMVAAQKLPLEFPSEWIPALTEYLASRQIADAREFYPDDPAYGLDYGGWDIVREHDPSDVTNGSSISISTYVLEALGTSDAPAAKEACDRARAWIARCAVPDGSGGFLFNPKLDSIKNKARMPSEEGGMAKAYGSVTADGVRCLLSLGTAPEDPLLTGAIAWLIENDRMDGVPGFEGLRPDLDWQQGLLFYYYCSLAKSLEAFPEDAAAERAAAIQAAVVGQQLDGGQWQNEGTAMRENEPLIATCFALIALGEAAEQVQ